MQVNNLLHNPTYAVM